MTKIKLCGLSRPCDIEWANELRPDYIGFVFAEKSSRWVSPQRAAELKALLNPTIRAVGVFVREPVESAAALLQSGIIDIAQLHGGESEEYIAALRALTDKPIFKAFSVVGPKDVQRANASSADLVLLDSGSGGTGTVFDWRLLQGITRPYFLAGGLDAGNVGEAISRLRPYGVDVSSGIETDGRKDWNKMAEFTTNVRKEDRI